MDAFGIASGLVAIHTRRPDNSFLEFVRRDNPNSPIFSGFSKANGLPVDVPGMTEPVTDAKVAADRIFKNIPAWAPPVPAPIDVKSVNWATDRYHANWDGNQGASSRTLASGASATGDPRMVNVRIHEPLNPFIDNLPPPPYPFGSVDLARAREGKALFSGQLRHLPHVPQSDDLPGLEAWRRPESHDGEHQRVALRTGRARDGSLPHLRPEQSGAAGRRLVRAGRRLAGATRRVLPRHAAARRGGHATATRPTCCTASGRRRRICTTDRFPRWASWCARRRARRRFLRGNLHYDEALVGFEWSDRPAARYGPNDTILIKEYDTTVPGKANTGHTFGADLCPDTSGLDPIADRKEIETRLLGSRVGALLAYLKTL